MEKVGIKVSPESAVTLVGSVLRAARLPQALKRNTAVVMIEATLRQQRSEAQHAPAARRWKDHVPAMSSRMLAVIRSIVIPLNE